MGQPRPLFFVYFRSFQKQILQKNCRRQRDSNLTRVRVESERADHLITTTAHVDKHFSSSLVFVAVLREMKML